MARWIKAALINFRLNQIQFKFISAMNWNFICWIKPELINQLAANSTFTTLIIGWLSVSGFLNLLPLISLAEVKLIKQIAAKLCLLISAKLSLRIHCWFHKFDSRHWIQLKKAANEIQQMNLAEMESKLRKLRLNA